MANSFTDLFTVMQNGVQAVESLTVQLRDSFPPITALTTSAITAGGLSYSSSLITAFGLVQTSSGGTYRIPLIASS